MVRRDSTKPVSDREYRAIKRAAAYGTPNPVCRNCGERQGAHRRFGAGCSFFEKRGS